MESLALAYRPRTFDDLVGQPTVEVFLRQMVANRAVPQQLLFCGPRGTGKTTTARILGAALNCEGNPVPCARCVSCKSIYSGSSLDVIELDAASNGLVDDIRALRQQILYSAGGSQRVIVLDEAHSMSPAAFNALLKILEEPPPGTVFVLCTTEPHKIPNTVLSRCMRFDFRRVAPADIVARLTHITAAEHLDADTGLLVHLASRADGGLRDAVMMLDQARRAGITTAAAYADLTGDIDPGPALLQTLSTADHAGSFAHIQQHLYRNGDARGLSNALIAVLRDVLVLHCDGTLPHTGNALQARRDLAAAIDTASAVAAMRVLWDLKTKLGADDAHATLDLAVTLIGELLAKRPATAPATAPGPAPAGKLTLAQMKAMHG